MANAPLGKRLAGVRRGDVCQVGNAVAHSQNASHACYGVNDKFARLQVGPLELELQGVVHNADRILDVVENIVNRLAGG